MLSVIDKQNRKVLQEGRNYQMGFAFCKRIDENSFETVQPLSPCKDYLNDVLYSEKTGRPFNACGLNTKKEGIFENEPYGYLAVKILNYHNGSTYQNMEQDKENLRKNHRNILHILHYAEVALGVKQISEIKVSDNDPDMYLLYVPQFWLQSTHLISLYSLMIRVGQFYDPEKLSVEEFMASFKGQMDYSLWSPAYRKFKCMVKFGVRIKTPQEQFEEAAEGCAPMVHGNGILAYN